MIRYYIFVNCNWVATRWQQYSTHLHTNTIHRTTQSTQTIHIKMNLQEVGCSGYGLDRAGSGYGQVVGTCECGNEPSGSVKCGEFLD